MLLWDALTGAGNRGTLHSWTGDRFESAGWAEVVRDAVGMAANARRLGVRPGTPVATILTNTPQTVRGLLAIWYAGGVVASLPIPTRGTSPQEYSQQLEFLIDQLEAPVLLIEDRLAGLIPDSLRAKVKVGSWESLAGTGRIDPAFPGEDELAFIQYSSGSTSMPKGCMLTPRAIAQQLEIVLDFSGGVPGQDTVASWLPLSHDMGIFGCLLYAWAFDFDLALSTPERFMVSPRTWFGDLASFGATMTAGTSTALHLASRAQGSGALARKLALRVCVVGAERVEWEVLQRTIEKFAPSGLRPEALVPAYGLAEATLAVTASPWSQAPSAVALDTLALADGLLLEVEPDDPMAARVVSTGVPCRGVSVVVGEDSGKTNAGELAEVQISSPSLAMGYHADPVRTRERFVDGRLHTGDLGFMRDGELYIVGRSDDLLSIAGRNVYARDVEAAIETIDLARKGCVVLVDVSVDGRSELVLFMELRKRIADVSDIAAQAAAIARQKAGLVLTQCLFLEAGMLPKTPSGKIQRFLCRKWLLDERFEPLARVVLGSA